MRNMGVKTHPIKTEGAMEAMAIQSQSARPNRESDQAERPRDQNGACSDRRKSNHASGLVRHRRQPTQHVFQTRRGQCEHQPLNHKGHAKAHQDGDAHRRYCAGAAKELPPPSAEPSKYPKNSLSGPITKLEFGPSARSYAVSDRVKSKNSAS